MSKIEGESRVITKNENEDKDPDVVAAAFPNDEYTSDKAPQFSSQTPTDSKNRPLGLNRRTSTYRSTDSHMDTEWMESLVIADKESDNDNPDIAAVAFPRGDDTTLNEIPQFINKERDSFKEHIVYDRKAPVIALLIPFSSLGVLIRLGLTALNTYSGMPVFSLVWAQFVGCIIMGFCLDKRGSIIQLYFPLYIGLSTGLCGSITTFSSWELSIFSSLSNEAHDNHNNGYNVLAMLADLIVTISLSVSGLAFGEHLGHALIPAERDPNHSKLYKIVPEKFNLFKLKLSEGLLILFAMMSFVSLVVVVATVSSGRKLVFATIFAPFGTILRWYLSRFNPRHPDFPLGTFLANMIGTAVLAVLFLLQHGVVSSMIGCQAIQGLEDGFCGCLTTISTFAVEITTLRKRAAYRYAVVSVLVGQLLTILILGIYMWTRGLTNTCASF